MDAVIYFFLTHTKINESSKCLVIEIRVLLCHLKTSQKLSVALLGKPGLLVE